MNANHAPTGEFVLIEALDLYDKHSSLSIIDCYATVEAKMTDNRLATFDKKLLKYGGTHMLEI